MDLLDFAGENLYFEETIPAQVEALIQAAGELYADGAAEAPLLAALQQAPESLNVLVAVYRFYYYQHRLQDALAIAHRALAITAKRLNIPVAWQALNASHIQVKPPAIALLRFHLLSLKAEAFLLLRMGRIVESRAMLVKLVSLDTMDRLGVKALRTLAEETLASQTETSATT